MNTKRLIAAALFAIVPAPAGALDVPSPVAEMIVAGPDDQPGRYRAGLHLDLPEGWHTYWRSPGDSGIPPTLTVTESDNLSGLEIRFPAPDRYFDGYGTSIVYHDDVILPIDVVAADPGKPVSATIRVDYGYCKEICVPASAEFDLTLDADMAVDPVADDALDAVAARIPVPEPEAGPAAPAVVEVRRTGDTRLEILVDPRGNGSVDLFAEGPDDWFFSPPERTQTDDGLVMFALSLDGGPKDATASGLELKLTLSAGSNSVEAKRVVD